MVLLFCFTCVNISRVCCNIIAGFWRCQIALAIVYVPLLYFSHLCFVFIIGLDANFEFIFVGYVGFVWGQVFGFCFFGWLFSSVFSLSSVLNGLGFW